jgi:hypothetical protein
MNDKKRHHFVPVTYLENFTAPSGKIFTLMKDPPHSFISPKPSAIGFERYYYSQPLADGGQDNNALENAFSEIEFHWPEIIRKLQHQVPLGNIETYLYEFLAMLRVRVPATRDMVELSLAAQVKAEVLNLIDSGAAPPPPPGFDFEKQGGVAIDPHRSLRAMKEMTQAFANVIGHIRFEVVHNETAIPYITSDNPVAYFDPDKNTRQLQPYNVLPGRRRIELVFPLTRNMMLRGHSDFFLKDPSDKIRHRFTDNKSEVKRHNALLSRFAYRLVFGSQPDMKAIAEKYQSVAPILKTTTIPVAGGRYLQQQWVFGKRPSKLKWAPKD